MAKNTNKKDKISSYNVGRIVIDIIMLFLGLIFIIGTLFGKGDDIAAGFVRVIGGILILVGVFALINFLRIKDKTLFDTIVLMIGLILAVVGIVFIVQPLPVITVFNFIFGIIIAVYAIVIIVTAVGTLKPAGAQYWWFSLLFGILALGLGVFIVFFNGASKALNIIIGATLVVGSIGGMANALLASQAKKEFKANSKILDDATFTVESTSTSNADSKKSGDDNVKY
ncbi:MAG: DUF308 domain-containing protein [Saccharofermentans sp.]|jgi:uncharacterized membrane protein HdeD (DUF308 family)|nr:DUF308 domain-containing protein [Clostridiales bacterium]MCR5384520.1 DUF308 domain-containing protein [Saccharofermentans sp.]